MRTSLWKQSAAELMLVASSALVVIGPSVAAAQHPPAAAPSEADAKKAQAVFLKGADLFKANKYTLALEQFKLSYATVPSPNSHLYIARCLVAMGEARNAYLEYDKVIAEAHERAKTEDRFAKTEEQARVERDELGPKLAVVTVTVTNDDPATTVRLGAHDVPRAYWGKPFPVDPSTIDVRVQGQGRPAVVQTMSLAPGDRRDLRVDPTAAPTAPQGPGGPGPSRGGGMRPLRVGAFVAAGVGVFGLGMFAIAGAMSASTYSTLKTKCGGERACPPGAAEEDVSAGKSQQTAANVGLVLGIVGVAAGTTMFVLSMRKPKRDSAASADLLLGPSWAGVKGTF